MKKITLSIIALLFVGVSLFAQSPESFKYQAVVRDASGIVLDEQAVGVQITILKGSASGTTVYSETHSATTNKFGLINLSIGGGTSTDDFSVIGWGGDNYFVKISIDNTGGSTYVDYGTSQLLSVPYALYAKNSGELHFKGGLTGNSSNLFIGDDAGYYDLQNGGDNRKNSYFIGYKAGYNNGTGASDEEDAINNTFIGNYSGNANTIGYSNVAIGTNTLTKNTTGYNNVAVGAWGLSENTTGNDNVSVGRSALISNTTGTTNIALGSNTLEKNTTGSYNTAFGTSALNKNTSGNHNTAFGTHSMANNLDGLNNVAVGIWAGGNNNGSGNVFLGAYAGKNETTASNKLIIANNATSTLIDGNFTAKELNLNANVEVVDGGIKIGNPDTDDNGTLDTDNTTAVPEGMIRYNYTTHKLQVRTDVAWVDLN